MKPDQPSPSQIVRKKNTTKRQYHEDDEAGEAVSDLPLQFSKTDAYKSYAPSDRLGIGKHDNTVSKSPPPPIQAHSFFISLGIFMLYFFWLREENDIDLMMANLDKAEEIYKVAPNLEKAQLLASIQAHTLEGKDTTKLLEKLEEITAKELLESQDSLKNVA